MNNDNIILWGVSVSPFVRKVLVALAEKELSYQHHEIMPAVLLRATNQAIPQEFAAASPLGKIPAMQLGNFTLPATWIKNLILVITYIQSLLKKMGLPDGMNSILITYLPVSPLKKYLWNASSNLMSSTNSPMIT